MKIKEMIINHNMDINNKTKKWIKRKVGIKT
jgi:hypothetical protein